MIDALSSRFVYVKSRVGREREIRNDPATGCSSFSFTLLIRIQSYCPLFVFSQMMVVILIGLAGRSATRLVVMARNTARAPAQTHCRPMAAMTAHGLVVTKKCLLATMDLVKVRFCLLD